MSQNQNIFTIYSNKEPERQALYSEIGEKVKNLRIKRNMTQDKLAIKLDITPQQVQKHEKAISRMFVHTLFEIAEALNVPVSALFPKSVNSAGVSKKLAVREGDQSIDILDDIENDNNEGGDGGFFSSFERHGYNGKKVILCILDGVGLGKQNNPYNAIAQSKMSTLNFLLENYPSTFLHASGTKIGLSEGQMGNSEVGHTAIGAGRVVLQDLPMINQAVQEDKISSKPQIQEAIEKVKSHNSQVHIIGLFSEGGIHSHSSHITHLAQIFTSQGITTNLHVITDGRDTAPKQFLIHDHKIIDQLHKTMPNLIIATISGRYFAMDRDKKWDRIKLAADAILFGKCPEFSSLDHFIQSATQSQIKDEFITPCKLSAYNKVSQNDLIIFANFRVDRTMQLAQVFAKDYLLYPENIMPNVNILSMMEYYEGFSKKSAILFNKPHISSSLAHVYSNLGLTQLKIAETEKYAHVTTFFNGGKEEALQGEDRILVPSPDVATYDLAPQMSGLIIAEKAIETIKKDTYNLIVINIANGDMVGHTGNFEACKEAALTIDEILRMLYINSQKNNYTLIVTADHGNIEEMQDFNKETHTQHTCNLVPFILCDKDYKNQPIEWVPEGSLANIAPTILNLCNIEAPEDMIEPLFKDDGLI